MQKTSLRVVIFLRHLTHFDDWEDLSISKSLKDLLIFKSLEDSSVFYSLEDKSISIKFSKKKILRNNKSDIKI